LREVAVRIRIAIIALLALVVGCPEDEGDDGVQDDDVQGDDDTTVGDDDVNEDPCVDAAPDDPCCTDFETLYFCQPWPGNEVTGEFIEWGQHTDPDFLTTEGEIIEFELVGTDVDEFPDLSEAGQLNVLQIGKCDAGGNYNALYFYKGEYPGELVLLYGNIPVADIGGWTVISEVDTETCPARPDVRCWEFGHNHAVTFQYGGESIDLFQGMSSPFLDYEVRVLLALSGSGYTDCTGSSAPQESIWYVVPGPDKDSGAAEPYPEREPEREPVLAAMFPRPPCVPFVYCMEPSPLDMDPNIVDVLDFVSVGPVNVPVYEATCTVKAGSHPISPPR